MQNCRDAPRHLQWIGPLESRMTRKCAAERGVESLTQSGGAGGMLLGHPIDLKAKAGGKRHVGKAGVTGRR